MIDEKEVLKALVCRASEVARLCDGCPYERENDWGCDVQRLCKDVLTLLKAQEPRVLPWEKVDKSGNTYVWAEIRSFITDEKALIYCKIVNSEFFHEIYRLREESGMEWARTEEDYNRDDSQGSHNGWRCWTARPTEEQRKAVKWDET